MKIENALAEGQPDDSYQIAFLISHPFDQQKRSVPVSSAVSRKGKARQTG
jgi:hypothetical protein